MDWEQTFVLSEFSVGTTYRFNTKSLGPSELPGPVCPKPEIMMFKIGYFVETYASSPTPEPVLVALK